jgi:ketosteroid isomerase-like protein
VTVNERRYRKWTEASQPNDLERLFIERANAGDLDGLVALFEPAAVVAHSPGQLAAGEEAIRAALKEMLAGQSRYELGAQRPALISGDLALTSTRLADGTVTAEVARRQPDGGWLWVIDQFDASGDALSQRREMLPAEVLTMTNSDDRERAMEPNDLARFFIERANAGDLEGLVAIYEPDAVLAFPPGNLAVGSEQIRAAFETMLASRPRFQPGEQRPALITGNLALTSTKLAGGGITTEVARRQPDGTWLWAIDQPNITG